MIIALKNLPAPFLLIGMIAFFILIAVGGVLLLRPVLLRRFGKDHDLLDGLDKGVKVAEVATALLIGMVVVQSLTNFLDAKQQLYDESAALGIVYRDALGIPGPAGEKVRQDVAAYNEYIIEAWPRIQQNDLPTQEITEHLTQIQRDIFAIPQPTPDTAESFTLAQLISDYNDYAQLRQARVSGISDGIEPQLYLLLFVSIAIIFVGVWVSISSTHRPPRHGQRRRPHDRRLHVGHRGPRPTNARRHRPAPARIRLQPERLDAPGLTHERPHPPRMRAPSAASTGSFCSPITSAPSSPQGGLAPSYPAAHLTPRNESGPRPFPGRGPDSVCAFERCSSCTARGQRFTNPGQPSGSLEPFRGFAQKVPKVSVFGVAWPAGALVACRWRL
ncbi:hypothetical protein ABTZ46_17890 [Nocardioides sp. NPDC126508]